MLGIVPMQLSVRNEFYSSNDGVIFLQAAYEAWHTLYLRLSDRFILNEIIFACTIPGSY